MTDTTDETPHIDIEDPQVWVLDVDGRRHEVRTSQRGFRNLATWSVDGVEVASSSGSADSLELVVPDDHELVEEIGAMKARFAATGRPRRVTHFAGAKSAALPRALVGTGGTDLDPEPGSRAHHREEWAVRHPVLASADDVLGGAGKVVVPLLLAALLPVLGRLLPDWDLDLPSVDLPSIPWPDLPTIPWPDISVPWPDVTLPGWLGALLGAAKVLWPLLLGIAVAVGEHRRRRRNAAARDDREAQLTGEGARDGDADAGVARPGLDEEE